MSLNFSKIKNVSAETKSAISRKSAQTLPNNPSERGYSAEEIKRRFYQPILDAANSALAEIDRVVNEANLSFSQVSDELDNFIDTTKIQEAYKLELDNNIWVYNDASNMYEVIISKEEHKIEDYKEIGVNMFLLDGDGKYTQVNQFEVSLDGTVRCFHETNGAGYLSIYVKREGFIVGNTIVDADHIVGLAKVGRTNSYNDLDDQPDLEQMKANGILISKMVSGEQRVGNSVHSKDAEKAIYANTSGSSEVAEKATISERAIADEYGDSISKNYIRTGDKATSSLVADKAIADENGLKFTENYVKKDGVYSSLTVGKALSADSADISEVAKKATSDSNGANISKTYATKTGNYPEMTVGNVINGTKYEELNLTANLQVYDTVIENYKRLGLLSIKGYGMKVHNESGVYWIGNLHLEAYAEETSFIESVDFKDINGIKTVISGGDLFLKEKTDLHYFCSFDNTNSNKCSYYGEVSSSCIVEVGNLNIVITNFIAKIE